MITPPEPFICVWNLSEPALKPVPPIWNYLKSSETTWNSPKYSDTIWDHVTQSEFSYDASLHGSDIFWNLLKHAYASRDTTLKFVETIWSLVLNNISHFPSCKLAEIACAGNAAQEAIFWWCLAWKCRWRRVELDWGTPICRYVFMISQRETLQFQLASAFANSGFWSKSNYIHVSANCLSFLKHLHLSSGACLNVMIFLSETFNYFCNLYDAALKPYWTLSDTLLGWSLFFLDWAW